MKIQAKELEATAYLAIPDNQLGPGILVFHPWWGLNDDIKKFCDQLAKAGYVAMALDYYNGRIATTIEEAEELKGKWDRVAAKKLAKAAMDALMAHQACQGDTIGTIGFSLGASLAVWLADNKPNQVSAVVLFYGLGSGNQAKTQSSYLGHFAENDTYENPKRRDKLAAKLRKNGRPVTFHIYPGTGHWFFEPSRPDAYDADAAELAWQRTLTFLKETI